MVIYIVAILLVITASVSADDIKGTVISVHDGDSYTMQSEDGSVIKVRQSGIDAPELKQEYGEFSADFNYYLLCGRTVMLHREKLDMYGRTIGRTDVLIGGKWYNAESIMLHYGMAWHYQEYDKSQDLENAEKEARSNRYGLWSKSNPTPPWEFRKNKRKLR